jgi:fused signal recognition particle receptor
MFKFISGLLRTKQQFTSRLANLLRGKKQIDPELMTELETILLSADVGVHTTRQIMQHLTEQVARKHLADPQVLEGTLKEYLITLLQKNARPLIIDPQTKPTVILMIGINGAGKTTTIGKLAMQLQKQGKKVMLAAGDTFRAAAIEQLIAWGEKNNIPVISQHSGADSASVIFDAFQAAKARGFDVLLADTAGRLHTQTNLMEELKKVKRVMQKIDPAAPHEVMLVLDASIGQNGLNQALKFHEALNVTGLVVTKLDGTAKGGVLFAIADQLNLPIRFIGVGESIEDLKPFNATDFVESLFAAEENESEA